VLFREVYDKIAQFKPTKAYFLDALYPLILEEKVRSVNAVVMKVGRG
jgi:hypothetical protein